MKKILFLLLLSFIYMKTQGQKSSENQLGTWYMYNGLIKYQKNMH